MGWPICARLGQAALLDAGKPAQPGRIAWVAGPDAIAALAMMGLVRLDSEMPE